jgi:hypothetical protein
VPTEDAARPWQTLRQRRRHHLAWERSSASANSSVGALTVRP